MYGGADSFISKGMLPFIVEPDFDEMMPRIRLDDPLGSYPEFNIKGECVYYYKRWFESP